MEMACIGFLLGSIVTMLIFIGGVFYGGAVTGDDRQPLSDNTDRVYNNLLSDSRDLKSDRSDLQNTDNEEEVTGAEA